MSDCTRTFLLSFTEQPKKRNQICPITTEPTFYIFKITLNQEAVLFSTIFCTFYKYQYLNESHSHRPLFDNLYDKSKAQNVTFRQVIASNTPTNYKPPTSLN